MKVISLQGIESNGANSIHKVAGVCKEMGLKVQTIPYLLRIQKLYDRAVIDNIVKKIMAVYEPGDIIFAHSAGAMLTHHLIEWGANPPLIWFFNAALDRNITFPEKFTGQIINIYDRHDIVLFGAQLLPFNRIGAMGMMGYCGSYKNVVNLSFRHKHDNLDLGHGDYFEDEHLPQFSKLIKQTIKDI